ncbi:type VI immunity family protein [Brenneria sp. g21c3]|uniref:type VI immunity family protein n=1 Tax=Brenneria sp. g21c3 TaxID=3093893 RepID=UPI002EA6ED56|nr:type VI immunity family protein [Brenneria sp. g21c3]
MDFFTRFEQARWEFTYGTPDSPEAHNALQVGLVAYFYLDKGYTDEKRQAMAQVLARYDREFGDKLHWGYIDDPKKDKTYKRTQLHQYQQTIIDRDGDDIDMSWASESGTSYASDYLFSIESPADWFEYVHNSVSYVQIYLPIEVLKDGGDRRFEALLLEFCQCLKPMHGLAGLGVQQCYARDKYQHLEYEIGQEFLAIDITNSNTWESGRDGIRSVNWYTFVQTEWLEKLGGEAALKQQLADPRLALLPYSGGVMIRAGDWPELGWVRDDPYPELYVKVNNALKPIRAPKIYSMGYGSISGEIRFDKNSTAAWLARFDHPAAPSAKPAPELAEQPEPDPEARRQFLTQVSGESCRCSGIWSTYQAGRIVRQHFSQGDILPPWQDSETRSRVIHWTLIARDDGMSAQFPA